MLLLALSLLASGAAGADEARCSIPEFRGTGRSEYSIARVEELVRGTPTIVRAVAIGVAPGDPSSRYPRGSVRLHVVEWLRGESDTVLVIPGEATAYDDFNRRPVPYQFRRTGGPPGPCNAFNYRLGAEYLLLLRADRSTVKLSPYWWYLGPSNEQLRDASDPWLAWVRGQLSAAGPSR